MQIFTNLDFVFSDENSIYFAELKKSDNICSDYFNGLGFL